MGVVSRNLRDQPHWVYRLFSANAELLYVGMTWQPASRIYTWSRNALTKPSRAWFLDTARISWQRYPDWRAAADAERLAIETEHPRHNVMFRVAEAS